VLLDLGLPGEDGLDLARYLRARSNIPLIIVSGRGETIDRVVGLELGADDYVSKPFDMRELLARVRTVLRRASADPTLKGGLATNRRADDDPDQRIHAYVFAEWTLDSAARRLTGKNDTEVTLTRGEFDLLLALVERPQRVLSRDQLLEITHNREAGPFDRTIDVQIGRLRRKINDDPQQPQVIKAVRGLGYQLAVQVKRVALAAKP
jgi:DNA-binding response OmpR family regulator